MGVLLVLAMMSAIPRAEAEVLGGAEATTLGREPLLTPDELGSGEIDGLEYADPTEGLSLVDPPEANSFGSAEITYPFVIPAGRGLTPDIDMAYSSSGANGWVGLGWDLSVGEISVDTTFGAPHFSTSHESESYLLDGDMLVPNAVDDAWVSRVSGTRRDYTRQVETEYEEIIRHEVAPGGPANYFWEVRDKDGAVRWYGGHPDAGGPVPTPAKDGAGNDLTIDRSAIVTDENGNAVRWLLSAERDVGVNIIRYRYETVTYTPSASGWTTTASCDPSTSICGRHTYLDRIDYTEASQSTGLSPDPAYQIHFLRDSEVNPTAAARPDPVVDASLGYVDVLPDRLARLQVLYGSPAGGAVRTYDQEVVQYNLAYDTGVFGKSLLSTVTQGTGADAVSHQFGYYDDVTNGAGTFIGFAGPVNWTTHEDLDPQLQLDANVAAGALGASQSNSGEGHVYIGFNPLIPQKVGSFGGSIQIGAGGTNALSEWIDLNGDNLPDKVFLDGSTVKYRLNMNGARWAREGSPARPTRRLRSGHQLLVRRDQRRLPALRRGPHRRDRRLRHRPRRVDRRLVLHRCERRRSSRSRLGRSGVLQPAGGWQSHVQHGRLPHPDPFAREHQQPDARLRSVARGAGQPRGPVAAGRHAPPMGRALRRHRDHRCRRRVRSRWVAHRSTASGSLSSTTAPRSTSANLLTVWLDCAHR